MAQNASSSNAMLRPGEAPVNDESRPDADDHTSLKLWLRMINCNDLIGGTLTKRFRNTFKTTGARFLLLAELDRHPDGLKMNELSQRMMVTGGNITALADLLEADGLIRREPVPDDRRAIRLRLTEEGKRRFDVMARTHEGWVVTMFEGLTRAEQTALYTLLGKLKTCVVHNIATGELP